MSGDIEPGQINMQERQERYTKAKDYKRVSSGIRVTKTVLIFDQPIIELCPIREGPGVFSEETKTQSKQDSPVGPAFFPKD